MIVFCADYILWHYFQAKEMFHKAAVIVRVLCKFLKVIQGLSTQQTPITAAQKSWHALKHTSEAKEILFNMTIFQKGKSVSDL